jgi:hypothetical protein
LKKTGWCEQVTSGAEGAAKSSRKPYIAKEKKLKMRVPFPNYMVKFLILTQLWRQKWKEEKKICIKIHQPFISLITWILHKQGPMRKEKNFLAAISVRLFLHIKEMHTLIIKDLFLCSVKYLLEMPNSTENQRLKVNWLGYQYDVRFPISASSADGWDWVRYLMLTQISYNFPNFDCFKQNCFCWKC